MRPINAKVWWKKQPLQSICMCDLSRHIAEFRCAELLTGDQLRLLARGQPQLRSLSCSLTLSPMDGVDDAPLLIPPTLTHAAVWMRDVLNERCTQQLRSVVQALCSVASLREAEIFSQCISKMDYAPFHRLPNLQVLSVWNANCALTELSDAQVTALRAMPQLKECCVRPTSNSLRQLLAQPHGLAWQRISRVDEIDAATASAVCTLSASLTSLEFEHAAAVDFLPSLRALQALMIREVAPGVRERLMDALLQCPQLTDLNSGVGVTTSELRQLLTVMCNLRKLACDTGSLDSLGCLAAAPPSLTSLTLWNTFQADARLPSAEMRHVWPLKQLRSLIIDCVFVEEWAARDFLLYAVPNSPLFPDLQFFLCLHPGGHVTHSQPL